MPLLEKLYEKHNDAIEIIAVTNETDVPALNKFVKDNKIKFKIVSDPSQSISKKFPSKYIPFITVLGKDGEIVDMFGYNPDLMKDMENLIKNYAPAPSDTDPMKLQRRGDEYLGKYRYEMAAMEYSKALELKPNDFELYYFRGQAYMNIYEKDKALEDYKKAAELNPKFYKPFFELGNYYKDDPTQIDNALDYLNKAIDLNQSDPDAFLTRSRIFVAKKDYPSALKDIDKAIELSPKDETGKKYRPMILADIPGSKVPAPDFTFPKINGKNIKISDFKGKKALIIVTHSYIFPNGVADLQELQKFYEKNSDKVEIIFVLHRTRLITEIKDDKTKSENINDVIKKNKLTFKVCIDPDYEISGVFPATQMVIIDKDGNIIKTVPYTSSNYKEQMKDEAGTIKEIEDIFPMTSSEKPIAQTPQGQMGDFDSIKKLAGEYFAKGEYEKALTEYEKAEKQMSDDPEVVTRIGICHQKLGNIEKAIQYFEKAIGVDAAYPDAYYSLGQIYRGSGKIDEALKMFDKSIELSPYNPDYYFARAMTFYYSEKYDSALADIDNALKNDPNYKQAIAYKPLIWGNIPGSHVKAPDFTINTLDGGEFTLSNLKGQKAVLIDQWASWCGPCRAEMPELQKFIDKYPGDVEIIAISRDSELKPAQDFVTQNGIKFKVAHDSEKAIQKLYPSDYIPLLVVVNKDGEIIKTFIGYDESVPTKLEELLGLHD